MGESLRGFEDPVRLYELRWQESGLGPVDTRPAQSRRRAGVRIR